MNGVESFVVRKVYDWRGVWGILWLGGALVLRFCVFMLWPALVIEFDKISLAATTVLVKLLLIGHLIEVCARAAVAAGFRLVNTAKYWQVGNHLPQLIFMFTHENRPTKENGSRWQLRSTGPFKSNMRGAFRNSNNRYK